jgi:small-conductance mechanosensitive channel
MSFLSGQENMNIDFLKRVSIIAELCSPVVVYLFLLIFIRIFLEKISFLKHSPFEHIFYFIKNILHIFIFIASSIFALGIFGVDVQGIITSLGLFSFALGFALKDVISNFLSGLFMFLYGPFKIGDTIIIDEYDGTVVQMDIRYTVLERKTSDLETESCYIPNSYLTSAKIIVKNDPLQKGSRKRKKQLIITC